MALGFVQGTFAVSPGAGTTFSKAFTSNVTAGNLLWAIALASNATSGVTLSDNAGNSWSSVQTVAIGTNLFVRSEAIVTTSGPCTVTATSSNSIPYTNLYIGEFNIGGHTLARDGSPNFVENTQSATTSFASGSITTTNNPDLLICIYDNNGSTKAFLSGMTAGWAENVWDSANQIGYSSAVVTTASTYSLTATQTSGTDDSIIYAYQATTASITPINATVSAAGKSVFSHGGRLLNNASVSV